MGILTARLPAAAAVAVFQSVESAARGKKSGGDPRTLNQLIADELYERLTGRLAVDGIDVEVGVVITDTALFAGTSDPAELIGYGPVPAELARDLLRPAPVSPGDPEREPARTADPPCSVDSPRGGAEEQLDEEMLDRVRADAKANANGFPGGRVPPGHCRDGPRCVSFACTLVHGARARLALPASARLPAPSGPTPEPPSEPPSEPPHPRCPGPPALARRARRLAHGAPRMVRPPRRAYGPPRSGSGDSSPTR